MKDWNPDRHIPIHEPMENVESKPEEPEILTCTWPKEDCPHREDGSDLCLNEGESCRYTDMLAEIVVKQNKEGG